MGTGQQRAGQTVDVGGPARSPGGAQVTLQLPPTVSLMNEAIALFPHCQLPQLWQLILPHDGTWTPSRSQIKAQMDGLLCSQGCGWRVPACGWEAAMVGGMAWASLWGL